MELVQARFSYFYRQTLRRKEDAELEMAAMNMQSFYVDEVGWREMEHVVDVWRSQTEVLRLLDMEIAAVTQTTQKMESGDSP